MILYPLQSRGGVGFGLRFMRGKTLRFFRALGFDYSHWFFIHEQYIVRWPYISLVFAYCLPEPDI